MKIIAIVQARMSSKRFPGKVLNSVKEKSLLQYILESLDLIPEVSEVIVATSTEKSDNKIQEFCNNYGTQCFRGSLNNVANRFASLIKKYECDAFIRVNGDSPLIDYRLIQKGINIYKKGGYDFVTNALIRTFPKGQSVEIVNSETFLKFDLHKLSADELEHVTAYFYNNKELFNIYNFNSEKKMGNIQLSVDTISDMKIFENIISKLNRPHYQYTWLEIIDIFKAIT